MAEIRTWKYMNRREFLITGATIGTLAGAGCSSNDNSEIPELQNQKIETTETACTDRDSNHTSVEYDYDKNTVIVTGRIIADDTCRKATIESAKYDSEEDIFKPVLTVSDSSELECQGCTSEILFTAEFRFSNGIPRSVNESIAN